MSMRKKIAILCNFPAWLVSEEVPSFNGHYAVWLKALYDSFAKESHYEIHWVSLNKDISKAVRFSSGGQFFHILPRGKKTFGLYTAYAVERFRIATELRHIEPDLVHSWGTEDCYGLSGSDFKGRWLHSVQGLLKAYMERGPMPRFFRHHSIYEPIVLRSCKHITTESPWAAERVRDIAPQATPLQFEYAVEERFFSEKRQLRETPTCLYCGNFTPLKNLQLAITTFSQPELSHIKLELAGVEAGSIPDLPPNIIPLGRISRDDVVQKLAQTWCLVHPSKADTGPGYVIHPDDVDALITRVLDITSSRERSLQMGSYNQERCRASLSSENMVKSINEIYEKTLKS